MNDRLGLGQLIDLQDLTDVLVPQVMDIMKVFLNSALRVNLSELFPGMVPKNSSMTIPEIRMEDGFLSLFMDLEKE